MVANPSIANVDPYGEGWLVILKPQEWDTVKATLVPGTSVAVPYEEKMSADGFAGCG
jgi:glycine cleavage system H protein